MNEWNKRAAKKNAGSKIILDKKPARSPLMQVIVAVAGFAFVLYCVSSIVLTQAEIAEKRSELAALAEKAEKLEEENDEYQSILSEEDEAAFMERYAVEVLGYAYPNERRFYDTTGK
ncbi:MAG: hypothetical protein J1E40_11720 [Oscillospiraceae bacterium]|nr:hypothetical protein [Oscillospiraceae bacterium]